MEYTEIIFIYIYIYNGKETESLQYLQEIFE